VIRKLILKKAQGVIKPDLEALEHFAPCPHLAALGNSMEFSILVIAFVLN